MTRRSNGGDGGAQAFRFPPRAARRSATIFTAVALAAFAYLLFVPATALAQEAPGEAQIRNSLAVELPAWWSIERVEIQAAVNDGDEAKPRWRQRFLADAAPAEELYARAPDGEAVGPFQVLIPTRGIADKHRLYGIAHTSQRRGEWTTRLAMENAVDGLGLPRSLFDGLTVVAGSERAGQVAASLVGARELATTMAEGAVRATVDEETLARLAAETTEAVESANRQRLDALRTRYDAERASLEAAAETARTALEEENHRRLDALKARLSQESTNIETMAAAAKAERAGLIAENKERLDALQVQYEEQRAALAAAAEAKRVELEEENRRRLETLKSDLDGESTEVEAKAVAAKAERERLVAESRAVLDTLQSQYEKDRVALVAAGEAARASLEEDNLQRLETLTARLDKESAEVEAKAADAETEQARLIAENEEILSSLKAKHERERASLAAASDTLLRASEAAAETAARQALAAALQSLTQEREREAGIAAQVAAADIAARTARYDALVEGLGSDSVARRYAAFDLALASGEETLMTKAYEVVLASGDMALGARAFDLVLASDDEEMKLRAFDLALDSSDERLKRKAVDVAVASDDEKLKLQAVARLPRITQWVARVEGFSSTRSHYDHNSVIGPPTNAPCSESEPETAWYSIADDGGRQWIHVSFAKPVLFPQVVVHETGTNRNSVGFVREIGLMDQEGSRTDYPVRDTLIACPGASEFGLWQHPSPVSGVVVVIDTEHHQNCSTYGGCYEGIDAIALIGTPVE